MLTVGTKVRIRKDANLRMSHPVEAGLSKYRDQGVVGEIVRPHPIRDWVVKFNGSEYGFNYDEPDPA